MEDSQSGHTYRFADFELDAASGELRKDGQKVRLQEQPFQILLLLVRRAGEVVTREEARHALWPGDTFVDFEVGLNSAVRRLRDALGDSAEHPRFVETLPRRGYRFIAPLDTARAADVPPTSVASDAAAGRRGWRATLLAAALAAAVLSTVAFGRIAPSLPPQGDPAAIHALAVLPFENLTGDPEQEYFVDGMTDALITDLAQARALRVISRTSVMRYKRVHEPLKKIASELGVDAVVEGTVARAGDRVRITAQLVQTASDRHLWAHSYEREVRDVLALQREVAAAITQAVRVQLGPEEKRRLTRARDVVPAAYDAYLKGRFYWSKREPAATLKAVEYFQQAVQRDPAYAPAYAGLSDAYRLFDVQGLSPPHQAMPKAEEAARKALALDDSLAEAHASLAGVLFRYHWDWQGAEREFLESLRLEPGSAETHRAYAVFLMTERRHEEALAEARRARELSPLSLVINTELATALVRLGRTEEAIRQARETLEIDPGFVRAYQTLGEAYGATGDWPHAVEAFERADALAPLSPHPWLGYFYARAGRRQDALRVLARLEKEARQRYVSPQSFAVVHLGLGDRDRALALLEKAYDDHAFEVLGFSGEVFDGLASDLRFQDLLRRLRLPTASPAAITTVSR